MPVVTLLYLRPSYNTFLNRKGQAMTIPGHLGALYPDVKFDCWVKTSTPCLYLRASWLTNVSDKGSLIRISSCHTRVWYSPAAWRYWRTCLSIFETLYLAPLVRVVEGWCKPAYLENKISHAGISGLRRGLSFFSVGIKLRGIGRHRERVPETLRRVRRCVLFTGIQMKSVSHHWD